MERKNPSQKGKGLGMRAPEGEDISADSGGPSSSTKRQSALLSCRLLKLAVRKAEPSI